MTSRTNEIDFWRSCPGCFKSKDNFKSWTNAQKWKNETAYMGHRMVIKHYVRDRLKRTCILRIETRRHSCGGEMYTQGTAAEDFSVPKMKVIKGGAL